MNYRQAIDYLNTFIDFERLPEPRLKTESEDIARFRDLLEELGNPHTAYPVAHVVGTKGKGSTSALLASILRAAGYRAALYTSPHLVSVRERIAFDGRNISRAEFAAAMRRIRQAFEPRRQIHPLAFRTVFELLTAVGFLHFARRRADFAVIEAGLGAKLDATIVVDPSLTIMTPIGLDHTNVLGDTVALIAADKSHAIKYGVPVVSAPQCAEALEQIERRASAMNSRLTIAGGATDFRVLRQSPRRSILIGQTGQFSGFEFELRLPGGFQATNLSTTLTAVSALRAQGYAIPDDAVIAGVKNTRWAGRLQTVSLRPRLILDGAHNTLAIRALGEAVATLLPASKPVVVFSAITGKPAAEMIREIAGFASRIVLTPISFPKSLTLETLREKADGIGVPCQFASDPRQALEKAKKTAGVDGVVIVTGSLYLVGEVLRSLKGYPPPPEGGGIDADI